MASARPVLSDCPLSSLHIQIRDSVFLGAIGPPEVAIAAVLVTETDQNTIEQSLAQQLDLISEQKLREWLALLDRFAHAGFTWLTKRRANETSIRSLTLTWIDEFECVTSDTTATEIVHDLMLDMLL